MVSMNPLNNYRGQVAVFYALLIPIFLFVGGVGLDLGWYYLNVSRLQNAADAAVLVGANKLIEEHDTFKNKNYKARLVDKFPADNPARDSDSNLIDTTAGDEAALDYAKKNLESDSTAYAPPSFFSVAQAEPYELKDSYTRGNPTVTLTPSLYKDDEDNYYYVLHLTENIHHFFIGFLDDMEAPVVAVAKISKDATSDSDVVPKVIFDANGGQINKSDGGATSTAELGELDKKFPVTIKLPNGYEQIPTREGYSFKGWSLNRDGSVDNVYGTDIYTEADLKEFFETYDPNHTKAGYDYKKEGVVTLYAVWAKIQEDEPNTKQPKVIFDANGGKYEKDGSTTASKDFKAASEMEDDEVSEPLTPSKGVPTNGSKEFKGWSKVKNPKEGDIIDIYLDGDQLSKEQMEKLFGDSDEVTLYAVWEDVRPNNNRTLWEQMQYLIAKNVYDQSWDVSTSKYSGAGTLIHNSFRDCSNTYLNSYHYYTEKIDMNEYDEQQYWASPTYRKIGEQTHYYLDFLRNGTINGGNTTIGIPKYGFTYDSKYRTHSLVNVNTLYEVRGGYNDDPLYCNFEGEPYVGDATPIRQIIININVSNLDDKYRPLFFYYEGPDARPGKKDRVSVLRPDLAQPVILNLNADFKGVLWMPDVPVVINGNGHKFEGFIVAKEYRYLDTSQGSQVKYSIKGQTNKDYSNDRNYANKIRINTSNGNVYTKLVSKTEAMDIWGANNANTFNLHKDSKFRTFKADTGVNFTYVFYDNNLTMDESPFHEYSDKTKELVPLYRLNASGEQVRVTKWEDVKLYDNAPEYKKDSNGKFVVDDNGDMIITNGAKEIPKTITGDTNIRTVRLDSNGNPAPVYDEAGNPVYYCESYVKVTKNYDVFTINRVDDQTRKPQEFLLTSDTTNISSDDNVSDTDDWK